MAGGGRWLGVAVGSWLVGGAAFGCSGTNLTGDAGDVPPNPADTVGNPCSTDTECDDGEPCNGVETCSPETGRCIGGAQVVDFTQCTTSDGRYASCVDGRCDLDYEEMLVPAGPFVMGADPDEDTGCDWPAADAWPERIVELSGYFIDRYEVTNKRYQRCQSRSGCPSFHRDGSFLRHEYFSDPAYSDFPLIYVDRRRAAEYCAYEGKRLPTEAEWEKAARGGCEVVPPETCGDEDERDLPWDSPPFGEYEDRLTCERANYGRYVGYRDERCPDDTSRVGLRPAGRSPYGVDDMIGNVREIVGDCIARYVDCPGGCVDPWGSCEGWADPLDAAIAVRGGSWQYTCDFLVHRAFQRGEDMGNLEGFRCVRPAAGLKAARMPASSSASGGTEGEGTDEGRSSRAAGASRIAGVGLGMHLAGGGEQGASTASLSLRSRRSTSRLA